MVPYLYHIKKSKLTFCSFLENFLRTKKEESNYLIDDQADSHIHWHQQNSWRKLSTDGETDNMSILFH